MGGWNGSPCFVSFFTDVCGLELSEDITERVKAYRGLCESANYFWINRYFVIVCERPKSINLDDKGRLHSPKKKSIEYKDGWGLYHLHGIQFTEQEFATFTSGKRDALSIMTEPNQDKKRVMIMTYGNDKLIQELGAVELSVEKDNLGYDMRLLKIANKEEPLIFYEAIDPSKNEKVYLRVPPVFETKRPLEAKLWGYAPLWEEYEKTGVLPEFAFET